MRPPTRWPLHPAPIEGEALSSWLWQIAARYDMSVQDLLEHGLGENTISCKDVDVDPPQRLLSALAERTGVDYDRLEAMTLAGWVPWLYDALQPDVDSYDIYVHQFSVMLKCGTDHERPAGPWAAWLPNERLRLACPDCLADPTRGVALLVWRLPLVRTCSTHRRWLQRYTGDYANPIWEDDPAPASGPGVAVLKMDSYTHHGLHNGWVELPQRRVHAAVWFRLLRTLINEVSSTRKYWRFNIGELHQVWDSTGYKVRAGEMRWKPYETLRWITQAKMLEAAAITIELLQAKTVMGVGADTSVFVPEELLRDYDSGPVNRAPALHRPSMTFNEAAEEAIAAAKEDPAEAQQLFNFLVIGCMTPQAVERVLDNFVELGIPIDTLSRNDALRPFT